MRKSVLILVLGMLLAYGQSAIASSIGYADIYTTVPSPVPGNVDSIAYEASGISQFGDILSFDTGGSVFVHQATLWLSNWAYESQYEALGTSTGFNLDFTLNLYEVGLGNSVGPLSFSKTINAEVPWRPEPDPANCPAGSNHNYLADDGNCYAGSASPLVFDIDQNLSSILQLGLVFSTQNYGPSPTGKPGPYNSLNLALAIDLPTVGSDPLPDSIYQQTMIDAFMADGGAGGHNIFRQDPGWSPYRPMVEVTGGAATPVPEPAPAVLFGSGGLAVLLVGYKRRRALGK